MVEMLRTIPNEDQAMPRPLDFEKYPEIRNNSQDNGNVSDNVPMLWAYSGNICELKREAAGPGECRGTQGTLLKIAKKGK